MNNLENKKVCHFDIYYLENSCEENPKKNLSFYENLSDEDLKTVTKNAFQELVSGRKNEDSDISYMFSPLLVPDLEVHLTCKYSIYRIK